MSPAESPRASTGLPELLHDRNGRLQASHVAWLQHLCRKFLICSGGQDAMRKGTHLGTMPITTVLLALLACATSIMPATAQRVFNVSACWSPPAFGGSTDYNLASNWSDDQRCQAGRSGAGRVPNDVATFPRQVTAPNRVTFSADVLINFWIIESAIISSENRFTFINDGHVIVFKSHNGHVQIGGISGNADIINRGTISFHEFKTILPGLTAGQPGTVIFENSGTISFNDHSSAGQATTIRNRNGRIIFTGNSDAGRVAVENRDNGSILFSDRSNADNATLANLRPSTITFSGESTAGNSTILSQGDVIFNDSARAGSAAIFNNIPHLDFFTKPSQRFVGHLSFNGSSSAANSNINNLGLVVFNDRSSAANATITNVDRGTTVFRDFADGASVKLIANGTGVVDFTQLKSDGTTVGSMEGTGTFRTGSKRITTGGLSPGHSIGTLNVDGNLTLGPSSVYLVEFSEAGDHTKVTGRANLAGTLFLDFLPRGAYLKQYNILHADGGFAGTMFSNIIAAPNFVAALTYNPKDVFLDLTPALGLGSALPGNASNVANSINGHFINNGILPPDFAGLYDVTGANLANELTLLSGEAGTGAQKVGFQLTDQFLSLLLDPFVDGRGGVGGADHPALGFAPGRDSMPPDIAHAYAAVPKAAPVYEPPWTMWGSAYGGSNRTTGDPVGTGSHDLSASTVGFASGFDYHPMPDTVVGLAFAGGGTNWSLSQGLGGGKSDAFQAGLYGATKSGPAYLAAAFAFANHWMYTDRVALGDHLTADFNAQSYGGRLEGGYRFGTLYGGITPYAAIQAQSFHTPGYTETGVIPNGSALTFNGRDATDTRSELGARFDRVLARYTNAVLALRGRLAWAHDWVSDPTLGAVFQELAGASFIVNGATPAENSALTSVGAELRLANGFMLLGKFDGEFAAHSSTYAGTGTLRYTW